MADTVTNNFSFTQPQVGGDVGTWGGILNTSTIAAIDAALGNNVAISVTSSDVSLTTSQMQNAIFVVSGALTGNHNIIIPLSPNSATVACGGCFAFVNNTTGNFTLTVITAASGSTGVTVPQGSASWLYSDGTNVWNADSSKIQFILWSGNPNGFVAGTAGSAVSEPSIVYDYTNFVLYFCTTTGNASSAVWTNIIKQIVQQSTPLPTLEGYLTPVSNTPIITGDSIAATTLYYTPFNGTWAAVHNGISIVPYQFSQMPFSLTTSQAASNIYDVFLAYNSGSPVIGTGPSWSAGTGGSVTAGSCTRGTGSGGTSISRDATTGLWVNTVQLSLIYNTGSGNNTITVSAGQGVYLGSIYIDTTAGQITCHRSFGQNRKWAISNAYNRWPVTLQAGDPTASWSYSSATVRASNGNSANSATSFDGLAQEQISNSFTQNAETFYNGASAQCIAKTGIGWNSTTAYSGTMSYTGCGAPGQNFSAVAYGTMVSNYIPPPSFGINVATSLESISGQEPTFEGTQANMCLFVEFKA